MAKDLSSLVVSLELQAAKYMQGMDQAQKRLEKFHRDTDDQLGGLAKKFAEFFAVEKIVEFADATLKASADLELFSKSAGISVENLSALQFAAAAGGVGTDQLNTAIKKLNVSMSDAAGNTSGKAALAFQLLGISVKNANGSLKDANQVFNEVADKFASTADGANKVALAVQIFGKAGQELIPTLNKGSAGIDDLEKKAKTVGATLDGPTAEAAEKFRNKLDLVEASITKGVAYGVERNLLPVLTQLADKFLNVASAGNTIAPIVNGITAVIKGLVAIGIEAVSEFKQVSDSVIALRDIGLELTQGHFKKAAELWKASNDENTKTAKDATETIAGLYKTAGVEVGGAIEVTAKKLKELGSLSGLEAFKAAEKELQAFVDGIQGEVAKLDQGKVAATNYALAHGKLAEAMERTGAKGRELASQAVAAATKLETIEITKQVEGLQASLKSLSGDTAGAALDNFAKSVETLQHQLHDVGGEVEKNGQAVIDNLKQATVYQQTFNTLQVNAARINQDAALAEQKVNNALLAGQITSIQAERELQKIRLDTISQLQGIKNGEDSIAAAANNPALTQAAKAFGGQIDALKAKTDELTNSVRAGLESAFANNFSDLITGAKSFGDAIHGLLKDVEKQFADLVAKNFAQQFFAGASGSSSGGAAGGLAPFLAGLFGGAHADGGTIPEGKIGLVGERGPELVMGAAGGTSVTPNSAIGRSQVNHFNFTVQAPGGQISRQSQQQTAALVSRSLALANRRDN